MSGPYKIYVGEVRIILGTPLAAHMLIEIRNANGTAYRQINELANGGAAGGQPVGWPWQPLNVYIADYRFLTMGPATEVTLPNLALGGDKFSAAEIANFILAAETVKAQIDDMSLAYPIGGMGVNSNSVWTTVLLAWGYDWVALPYGSLFVPGLGVSILTEEALEAIRIARGIAAPTGPPPNYAQIGKLLGSMVVQPQTQAAVVLSSLGAGLGTLGSTGTFVQGGYLVNAIGSMASSVNLGFMNLSFVQGILSGIPGAGILLGFILGAFIGNMFGRKKPRVPTADAQVVLQIPGAKYALGAEQHANNGDLDLVRSMAVSARDTLNSIIEVVVRGDDRAVVANTSSPTQVYGHTGQQLWVKLGGTGAAKTNVDSADEAVDKGVLWALPATRIIGGDLFLERAIYNQIRNPEQAERGFPL